MVAEPRFRRRGTVRTRTTVAATLVFGVALLVGGTVMLSLLRRSLVRNLDDVADIRSDDIAALARTGTLPPTLSLEDDAVGQVVDDQGRILAASANVSDRVPIAAIHPAGAEPVTRTVDDLPGVAGEYRLLAFRVGVPRARRRVFGLGRRSLGCGFGRARVSSGSSRGSVRPAACWFAPRGRSEREGYRRVPMNAGICSLSWAFRSVRFGGYRPVSARAAASC